MGKKKATAEANGSATTSDVKAKSNEAPPQEAGLTITRNKHTRFISAFHGPWLQLPHEILDTLAHSNYLSPRPRQTDPSCLYDLIKIRRLVDDASDLAVRAANGTASSALGGGDNGLPGGALGLSYRGAGGNARLSPERKYRMRELAVQKLSQAYRLDEIAASVATMQGASALDQVASFVLQRNPANVDARYVHFFHEKIPSRMMSESTPLTALNEIISAQPGHAAPYRSRALTRIFKEDYIGAVQDLTDALTLCRMEAAKHKAGRNQLVTMETVRKEAEKRRTWNKEWMQENKVMDEDQPKGIEMQLLFQRGNQYLTLACRSIRTSLEALQSARQVRDAAYNQSSSDDDKATKAMHGSEEYRSFVHARELVRKYAKRAQKDYVTFFSKLDYAHAPRHPANDDLFARDPIVDDLDDFEPPSRRYKKEDSSTSTALTRRPNEDHRRRSRHSSEPPPPLSIYEMSSLVSTSPPANLPAFPPSANEEDADDETLTYHPLLPETLHSFLLTHCLLQTDATTLLRHSYNVARLVRLADGYPFFLAARSPARADWSEILRKTHNWIGMSKTWEQLCKLAPPSSPSQSSAAASANGKAITGPGSKAAQNKALATRAKEVTESDSPTRKRGESIDQKKDRIHKEAVMDALGDERVVDDETFHRAVQAREKRAWRDSIEAATKDQLNGAVNAHKEDALNGTAAIDEAPADDIAPAHATDDDHTKAVNGTSSKQTNGTTNGSVDSQTDGTADSPVNDTPTTNGTPLTPADPTHKPSPPKSKSTHAPLSLTKRESTVAKDEEYLIGTERAEAIALWVQSAPAPSAVDTSSLPGKKKRPNRKKRPQAQKADDGINGEEHCAMNGETEAGAEEEVDE